jgi:hypothetical protein
MTDEILVGLREVDIARSTPLQDAVDRADGLELTATKDSAKLEFTKTKGDWSVSAAVAWAKSTGSTVIGKLKWSPK